MLNSAQLLLNPLMFSGSLLPASFGIIIGYYLLKKNQSQTNLLHLALSTGLTDYTRVFVNTTKEKSTSTGEATEKNMPAFTQSTSNFEQPLVSEPDPHFIFNSFNTLNYLISNNQTLAIEFNNKLAIVYKHILIHRTKELSLLTDELNFIESYLFILEIRHEGKLHATVTYQNLLPSTKIPACALLILVENIMKQNKFTETDPLQIKIAITNSHVAISNNLLPTQFAGEEKNQAIKIISERYQQLYKKNLVIEKTDSNISVMLPFIE